MSVENQVKLDREIQNLMKMSTAWFSKQNALSKFDLTPFYDAFENEITY
jgi:hypothetical protein